MKKALTQKEKSYYSGILLALSLIYDHDQETMYDELMALMEDKVGELVSYAIDNDDYVWSGLEAYKYTVNGKQVDL